MAWMMMIWSMVSAGLIIWFADAEQVVHGSWGREKDGTSCASCRHDVVAHQHADPGTDCSQCPCPWFRGPV